MAIVYIPDASAALLFGCEMAAQLFVMQHDYTYRRRVCRTKPVPAHTRFRKQRSVSRRRKEVPAALPQLIAISEPRAVSHPSVNAES